MSAFLGPIHYWLYHKIQLQQEIIDDICELGKKHGLSLEEDCSRLYGSFENKPLEQMIDQGNIHGWLQERVSQVEYKYAYCVTKLLEKAPETYDMLKSVSADNGTDLAITAKEFLPDPKGVYQLVEDNLLDGMPCDHANRILEFNEEHILWTRVACVHRSYWVETGGDIRIYYELRDAWIRALARELGYRLERPDDASYCIKAYASGSASG